MKSARAFFSTPTGQLVLVGGLAALAAVAAYRRWTQSPARMPEPPLPSLAGATPRTFRREGALFPQPKKELEPVARTEAAPVVASAVVTPRPAMPLSLTPIQTEPRGDRVSAPYGRLIPCETVLTLESNRLETPVIGLVTEDVWHDGRLIVPKGAEVHGRTSTDRARERLAAQGAWRIVWRTPGADNGTELKVQGIALDREREAASGRWGIHDGSAGLRGQVLTSNDWREVQLFAATFLSAATLALQDTRTSAGVLGETVTPAATARNAALAGTSAVLRDQARQLREAIERDGIYVRVPAGKPFYLYVTQTLDRSGHAPSDHAN